MSSTTTKVMASVTAAVSLSTATMSGLTVAAEEKLNGSRGDNPALTLRVNTLNRAGTASVGILMVAAFGLAASAFRDECRRPYEPWGRKDEVWNSLIY